MHVYSVEVTMSEDKNTEAIICNHELGSISFCTTYRYSEGRQNKNSHRNVLPL